MSELSVSSGVPTAWHDWLVGGTGLVEDTVGRLADSEFAADCALPDWTRAHLVTHLARNADALTNLLTWARTGVPTPMYRDQAQRADDIERGAGRTAAELRADLKAADERFAAAAAAMAPEHWEAQVRTTHGRVLPARDAVWMRVREVWVHAVDLAAGIRFADLPPDLVDAMLEDVAPEFTAASGCPPVRLRPADRPGTWSIGGTDTTPTDVDGPAADLLGWLLGRGAADTLRTEGALPELPRWL